MVKKLIKIMLSLSLVCMFGCSKSEKITLPVYEHYEPEEFYENLESLLTLAEENKTSEMLKLYDKLYDELLRIYDICRVCDVEYSKDFTSDYYAEELNYIYEVAVECDDRFCSTMHKIATGSLSEKLKEHVSEELFLDYSEYEDLTDEMKDLLNRQNALVTEYDGLDQDADDFYDVAGDLFIQLVSIRKQIATLNDYDSYCDYADVEIFDRDYNAKELEGFHKAIKTLKDTEYEDVLIDLLYYDYPYEYDAEEHIANLKKVIYGISDLTDEAYDFFVKNKLYYLGNDEINYECSFTTTYPHARVPFIYSYIYNDGYDVTALTHEFGHFTDAYLTENPNPVFIDGCYDLYEIHSTGLEMLAARNYKKVLDDPYDYYEIYTVLNSLENCLINGCLVDEWERIIYTSDEMSIDEICRLFDKLVRQYYYIREDADVGKAWMNIPHTFETPMYYISYATSYFASLQLWEMGLTDYDKAVKTWEEIVKRSAYYTGYMEVVEDVGLIPFSDSKKVEELLDSVIESCARRVY